MIFSDIKLNVRANLDDAGVTFYSLDDIIDSIQDGYDDISFQAKNIIKKTQVSFKTSPYYDFSLIGDFIQTIAIFNNNTNRFLKDNLSLRDFDKFRSDWEIWSATPEFWCTADLKMNVIVPYYSTVPAQQFDLYYAAQAPTLSDADTPLIANDYQKLLEFYATADMLEQAEEYAKALPYWELYIEQLDEYKEDVQLFARRDLLTVI